MRMINLLTGGKSYIDIVKEYIDKIFVHEARKYKCKPDDLQLVIYREYGKIMIGTYSVPENKVWRIIPDKEVEQILMK